MMEFQFTYQLRNIINDRAARRLVENSLNTGKHDSLSVFTCSSLPLSSMVLGRCTPFTTAACWRMAIASFVRPLMINHRTDSGIILSSREDSVTRVRNLILQHTNKMPQVHKLHAVFEYINVVPSKYQL